MEVAAYYVVGESLTNAARYAEAEVVAVRVAAADGALTLSVSDAGVGGAVAGSGLGGLRDRVEALSGQLDIDSPPGGGSTVTAVVPAPVSG
ncbi:ATP-binding protein [Mycolicibacterium sp. A43C]